MVEPPFRWLVPEAYPVIASVRVDRPVLDEKIPNEDLLGHLPPPPNNEFDEFEPTVWGPEAYAKSFEKFHYKEPSDFLTLYPELCRWADKQWYRHFWYLNDTRVIHITATEKNQDSTPAFPKHTRFPTERDFLETYGWEPYIREFSRVDNGDTPSILWYLFMKKEVLKSEKVASGDIRQILCADPIYARIGACFEQHQNHLMKQRCEDSSGQCGWSPFAGGFQRLMLRLEKPGSKYVEFDWTRFDGTIPPKLFMHIKKLRWSLINPRQRKRYQHMYKWYCHNLINRYVLLPSGEITKQTRGNPSGQISTTMDNNMVNYWLQAFEFAYFFGPDDNLWRDYDTIVYGDDRLSRFPKIPDDYESRVIEMYADIFGMWVKPGKVKVSDTLVGLTFCGFQVGQNYEPFPHQPYKLMAGLLKPSRILPDLDALHGKLLSYQVLMHNTPGNHPFKDYIETCLARVAELNSSGLPARFTEEQLDRLWRGGPRETVWHHGQGT